MPDKPLILLADKGMAAAEGYLTDYRVAKLWEAQSPEAFAASAEGQALRAIVALGSVRLDPGFVDALPALGLIACAAVGFDGIDVARARARGVDVTNAAGANSGDVADLAVGLLLSAIRELSAGERRVREGAWTGWGSPTRSMQGLKVGLLGYGAIGRATAERLQPFGCEVRWWGRSAQPDAPILRAASVHDLFAWSDAVIIGVRADAETNGMVDRALLDALGPQGVLVNVARGSVVDEDALIAALKDRRLGGAALDVFAKEPTPAERWADVPNTVLTPHTGGFTGRAMMAMRAMLQENLRRFFAGEPLLSPVPAG